MSQFHPDIHWLMEYTAGNLPFSQALCVAVHLSHCKQCRDEIQQLNSLGGLMMAGFGKVEENPAHDHGVDHVVENTHTETQNHASDTAADIPDALRNKVFDLIDQHDSGVILEQEQAMQTVPPALANSDAANEAIALTASAGFPQCLNKLLPEGTAGLEWKKLSTSLSVARLGIGDTEREVALHKIKAGGGVANHDHKGREVTVVLTGSFSDQNGLYLPGDFLVKEPGEEHRPMASEDGECICLSVLEAPVKFTGPITRMINPFLRIYPSAS